MMFAMKPPRHLRRLFRKSYIRSHWKDDLQEAFARIFKCTMSWRLWSLKVENTITKDLVVKCSLVVARYQVETEICVIRKEEDLTVLVEFDGILSCLSGS